MQYKQCATCGTIFSCGPTSNGATCWCTHLPNIMPLNFNKDCSCPQCLTNSINNKIATAKTTSSPSPKQHLEGKPLSKDKDYIIENGKWIFTAHYHLERGYCCKNGCRNCPYGFKK